MCLIHFDMEVIQSFTIDHTNLKPGIYVSREDQWYTTFDLRITEPNKEPALSPAVLHSIEHLMATWFRNNVDVKGDVVYVGPMGCLTGFYLILKGNRPAAEIFELVLKAFVSVEEAETVPGATPKNCGYYLMHNLAMAKWYAKEFADYLTVNAGKTEIFEYPKTERLVTDDGQAFYDS